MKAAAASKFKELFDGGMESLFRYFLEHEPAGTRDDFYNRFIVPARYSDGRIVGMIYGILEEIRTTGKPADLKFGTMWLALGHLCQAMNAFSAGDEETAYILLSEGRYWQGVTWASRGLDKARLATIAAAGAQAISDRNRRAAQSKNKELREEAYRLARELRNGKVWQSRNYAAGVIAEKLRAFAKQEGVPALAESQERKTVDSWLGSMPDAAQLFSKKLIHSN